ncbi:type II toxin-antitoxin system PemK/MazF family toxin [Candidatus Woesearchaeota archaeon]|nr:type II toxin-antitoxin system PemK/MazF family toxin [Candidatus Woesearchaeota archaeon]
MNEIKRGDIWLVSLDPTIGHEINKTRPCVIIQNDTGNKNSPLTIIAPITSQHLDEIYPIEVALPRQITRLDKDSKAMLDQIRTIDKRRLIKKICALNKEIMQKINEALKTSLGL